MLVVGSVGVLLNWPVVIFVSSFFLERRSGASLCVCVQCVTVTLKVGRIPSSQHGALGVGMAFTRNSLETLTT